MTIRIYVANLAAYNSGELIGEWIDLPMDAETLRLRVQAVLDRWNDGYGPSEEVAIHDFEAPWAIGEYDGIETVNALAERFSALDETDDDIIAAVIGNWVDVDDGLTCLENGEYRAYVACDDMSFVAAQYLDECGILDGIPDEISRYFDYDAYGRDLDIGGTFIRYDGGYVEITG